MEVQNNHLFVAGWVTSNDGTFPAGLPGQMSAFVPNIPSNNTFLMKLDVAAPIVEITNPPPNTSLNSGNSEKLTALASTGAITWYESGVPLAVGNSVTVTLSDGSHQISAIATDDAGRIGMAGVVIDVGLPVAVNDTANTLKATPVTIDVLANDADPDGDTLTVSEVSEPRNGIAVINEDETITYSPNAEFTGTDWLSYTISDGKGGTDSAWVSVSVSEPSTDIALYVYDIRFVQHGKKADWWQAVYEIRSDSNGNNEGDINDNPVEGVAIEVDFAGRTFTGTTDSTGIFTTDWVKGLSSDTTYYANVLDLVLANYYWNPLTLDLEDDSGDDDNPARPDAELEFWL